MLFKKDRTSKVIRDKEYFKKLIKEMQFDEFLALISAIVEISKETNSLVNTQYGFYSNLTGNQNPKEKNDKSPRYIQ